MSLKNLRYWMNEASKTNSKGPTLAAILMRNGVLLKDIDLTNQSATPQLFNTIDVDQVAATFCKDPTGGWGGEATVPGLTGGAISLYVIGKGNDLNLCVQEMTLKLAGHQSRLDILTNDPLAELEVRLQQHDWFYDFSDDGNVYRAGEKSYAVIRQLLEKLNSNKTRPLWDKYAPKEFQFPDPHRSLGVTVILFLNIDGVINRLGTDSLGDGELDKDLMETLIKSLSMSYHDRVEVVLHTSRTMSIADTRALFTRKGFKFPERIIGRTCCTGGDGVRQYLIEHKLVGHKFIIIDDETHDYGELWCRLIVTDGRIGITAATYTEFRELYYRYKVCEEKERTSAVNHLISYCHWLAKTSFLSEKDRQQRIRYHLDIVQQCLTVPNFLERAFLKEPPK